MNIVKVVFFLSKVLKEIITEMQCSFLVSTFQMETVQKGAIKII